MSRGHLVLEHAIDEITEGHSYRRDLGDLEELAESIRRFGLLSPIVITSGNVLISGNRRLAVMRDLGHRTVPVWVVPGVSDKLSTVLAIQDENTLHKMLTPIEQAELYEELKALYADEAARREAATRFGSDTRDQRLTQRPDGASSSSIVGGGVDSTPPQPDPLPGGGKARVQAAKAVTGRDSHSMLDQVVELKQIAASDAEHPEIRQAAAEALLELNEDGKVNGRYLRVKLLQTIHTLKQWAQGPDEPDPIRAAASTELELITSQDHPKDALKEATRALARLRQLRKDITGAQVAGWKDVDPLLREKHAIRKLVDLLRRDHGWWDRYDPAEFGKYADDEQWDLVATYVTSASSFLDQAQAARDTAPGQGSMVLEEGVGAKDG